MFNIKRNKKSEIILDVQLNPMPLLLKLAYLIEKLFSSKIYYTIPMGLGIGFGFAIVVFSNPTTTIANSQLEVRKNDNIIPKEIIIENINFTSVIKNQTSYSLIPIHWRSSTINFLDFPGKTSGQLVIASKNNFLHDVKLGEKIIIKGANNGIYQFSTYEIKEIESKDINNLMVNNQAKVIVLNPVNILGTNFLTVLAK
ncbi:MAG: hypothetical protein GW942_01260 [Candidatus Pacebacteria bacterium]|nr:hypothetical protein [Candidatus Paceibacterota bacterium]